MLFFTSNPRMVLKLTKRLHTSIMESIRGFCTFFICISLSERPRSVSFLLLHKHKHQNGVALETQSNHPNNHVSAWLFEWIDWVSNRYLKESQFIAAAQTLHNEAAWPL
jgi:hypothetical protein